MTILCESDLDAAARLVHSLDGAVHTVTSLPDLAMAVAADPTETVVVIGTHLALEPVLSFSAEFRAERPDAAIILLRDSIDPGTLAAAAGAGVREVVAAGSTQAIVEACGRARLGQDVPQPIVDGPPPNGRIVTVFSAKGGCGKTTLATNLAVVLNAGGERRVCLVDLDLEFGDVAISMQLAPTRTLIDAVAAGGNIDTDNVGHLLTPYRPGLDCVLAPVEPGDAGKIPGALVTELLEVLSRRYDFVVVDTPSQFSEHVLSALDASHHHVLLTTPEIPSLKNLRLTLDMLDLLSYNRDARAIVLNRSDAQVGLSAAEVQEAIKSEITAYVPSSRDVPASINRGTPLAASHPDHAVSQAIRRFAAQSIAGESTTTGRRSGRRGLRLRMRSA